MRGGVIKDFLNKKSNALVRRGEKKDDRSGKGHLENQWLTNCIAHLSSSSSKWILPLPLIFFFARRWQY